VLAGPVELAAALQEHQVGLGLADRGAAHEAVDLLPRPRPRQPRGYLPDRLRAVGDQRGGGLQALLVVGDDGVDTLAEPLEAPFVRRQDRAVGVLPQALQRGEVVAERVAARLRVERHGGGDPREHVVAAEQQPRPLLVEAEVARGVAGSVDRHELPARHVGTVAVGQQDVGRGDHHHAAHRHARVAHGDQLRIRRPRVTQPGNDPIEQVVDLVVAVVDQGGVGRVQRHPRAGDLSHPPGQSVVVGVQVGDQHAAHVGQRGAHGRQAGLQGRKRLGRVPAGVDHDHPAGHLERVGEHVAQGASRDRHRQAPQTGPDRLGRWQVPGWVEAAGHGLLLGRGLSTDSGQHARQRSTCAILCGLTSQ